MGNEPLNGCNKMDYDFAEEERNEASNLLYELIEKVENKKNEINTYLEDVNNLIIEIKDVNNNVVYIRRRIYDSLNVMKSMKLFRKDRITKKIMWNYFDDIDIHKVVKGDNLWNIAKQAF